MMLATTRSGHARPVPKTPIAARIARAIPEQHRGDGEIYRQSKRTDGAHRSRVGRRPDKETPDGRAEHPQAESQHGRRLYESRTRAPDERHPRYTETDSIVCRITEKVERVGLQGARIRSNACHDLHAEHDCIKAQCDPQNAPPCRIVVVCTGLIGAAAGLSHLLDSLRRSALCTL